MPWNPEVLQGHFHLSHVSYNANYGTWAFSKLIKIGLLSKYNVGGYSVPCSGVAARVNRMGVVRTEEGAMLKTLICWLLGHDWYDYGEREYACSRCGYDDPNNRK